MNRSSTVAVVDFGGRFPHMTARAVFELGYVVQLIPCTHELYSDLRRIAAERKGRVQVVLAACNLDRDPRVDPRIFDLDLPFMGICNGHQLIARAFGGEVVDIDPPEIGRYRLRQRISAHPQNPLHGLPETLTVSMYHRQALMGTPDGFTLLASTERSPVAAFASHDYRLVGFQFHPEVPEIEYGQRILANSIAAQLGPASNYRKTASAWLMSAVDRIDALRP